VIPGTPRRIELPADRDVEEIANRTITGIGDFLVASTTGRPLLFEDFDLDGEPGLDSTLFTLGTTPEGSGEEGSLADERWYRFTTLGDGVPGSVLRVLPFAFDDRSVFIDGDGGYVDASGALLDGFLADDRYVIGGDDGTEAVLEFDVSDILEAYDDPTEIDQAFLSLLGTVTVEPFASPRFLEVVGDDVYFSARATQQGDELWRSDGTAGGTVLVGDIRPGPGGSGPRELTAVGDRIYFTANDGTGTALWFVDPQTPGPQRVSETLPGGGSAELRSRGLLTAFDDRLFFSARDASNQAQIWATTPTGVEPITSFDEPERLRIRERLVVGDEAYWSILNGATWELWRTPANDPANNTELLHSYVDQAGVEDDLLQFAAGANIGGVDYLFFAASDAPDSTELWRTNGDPGSIVELTSFNSGGGDGGGSPRAMVEYGGLLYFMGFSKSGPYDGEYVPQIWRSDATVVGTQIVHDLAVTSGQPRTLADAEGLVAGGKYFFTVPGLLSDRPPPSPPPGGISCNGREAVAGASISPRAGEVGLVSGSVTGEMSVSHAFKVREAGTFAFSFCQAGGTANYDTWICVVDEAGEVVEANGNPMSNDDHCGLLSEVEGVLSAGDYYVVVSGFSTSAGDYTLAYVASVADSQPTPTNRIYALDGLNATHLPTPELADEIRSLTVLGDEIAFAVRVGGRVGVWRSDGAARGTFEVGLHDATIGDDVVSIDGRALFTSNNISRPGLWTTDHLNESISNVIDFGDVTTTLTVDLVDVEGDGVVTRRDFTATATTIGADANTVPVNVESVLRVDITDALRGLFGDHLEKMTLRISGDVRRTEFQEPISVDPASGLEIVRRHGVRADLHDVNGGVRAEDFSALDLRELDAGTYYLRVFNPHVDEQVGDLPFAIEVKAPLQGKAHPLTDLDRLRGGEGEDILVGGFHLDQLFGESGDDAFFGEDVELRDFDDDEIARPPDIADRLVSEPPRELDRIVDIEDAGLRQAVADALDIPIVERFDGPQFAVPVYATDLARLVHLDASDRSISTLDGLEYASNLVTLNLSRNDIADASRLALGRDEFGAPTGPELLRHLSLDSNPLRDVSPFENLIQLRVLSVDDTDEFAETGWYIEGYSPDEGDEFKDYPDFDSREPAFAGVLPSVLNLPDGLSESGGSAWRFAGRLFISQGGRHEFRVDADEGARLFVDGQLVAITETPGVREAAAIDFEPGFHDILLEYFEDGDGVNGLVVEIQGPSFPNREYLNGSFSTTAGLGGVEQLDDLPNLRFLSLRNNSIRDAGALGGNARLELLDLSRNNIASLDDLAGAYAIDDTNAVGGRYSEPTGDWRHTQQPFDDSYLQGYRYLVEGPGEAVWTFTELAAGSYDVFATWHAHERQASDAVYTVRGDGDPLDVEVNQRFEPLGQELGGRPWQRLATVEVDEDGVVVRLSGPAGGPADGTLIADAILLVDVEARLPALERLDVENNPLGNSSHDFALPILSARAADGFDLAVHANDAVRWLRTPTVETPINAGPGESLLSYVGVEDLLLGSSNQSMVVGVGGSAEALLFETPGASSALFTSVLASTKLAGEFGERAVIGGVYGSDGNLYVLDDETDSIHGFDGVTGELIATTLTGGTDAVDLAADDSGHVYTILRSGGLSRRFHVETLLTETQWRAPPLPHEEYSLTIGPLGDLYVGWYELDPFLDILQGGVRRFDAFDSDPDLGVDVGGVQKQVLVSQTELAPLDLVFATNGDLYIADGAQNDGTYVVLRYSAESGYETAGLFLPQRVLSSEDPSRRPRLEIGPGPEGTEVLYLVDPALGEVLRFDLSTGDLIDTFVAEGSGGLTWPTFVAFPRKDYVYSVHVDDVSIEARAAVVESPFGDTFFAEADSPVDGFLEITLVAQDGPDRAHDLHGRSAAVKIDFQTTGHAVYGREFLDLDQDTIQDADEPGLENWTVYLDLDLDGFLGAEEPSTRTDANGDYVFHDAPAGVYAVRAIDSESVDGILVAQSFPVPIPDSFSLEVEAEDYDRRFAGSSTLSTSIDHHWRLIDATVASGDEGAGEHQGVSNSDGGPGKFAGASGGFYMQLLPEINSSWTQSDGSFREFSPALEFDFEVPVGGRYQLAVQWDGFDGGSDSLYASIDELRDGLGSGEADWYRYAHVAGPANFAAYGLEDVGDYEDVSGWVGRGDDATFTLAADSTYTLRFVGREDGAAIDKWRLELLPFELHEADFSTPGRIASSLDGFTVFNSGGASDPGWRLTTARQTNGGHTSPHSAFFGTSGGDLGVGNQFGTLTSTTIDLRNATSATLSFSHNLSVLGPPSNFLAEVLVDGPGVPPDSLDVVASSQSLLTNDGAWHDLAVDLTPYLGEEIAVVFHFAHVNLFGGLDGGTGWFIDDVVVTAELGDNDGHPVSFDASRPLVIAGRNFANVIALDVDGPASALEGEVVQYTANVGVDVASYDWSATGGSVADAGAADQATFSFTPAIDGVYRVDLEIEEVVTTDTFNDGIVLFVADVDPIVDAGLPVTLPEGELLSRTLLIQDPGDDGWTVSVDYGDGTMDEIVLPGTEREFSLASSYADEGTYTVTITVTSDDPDEASDSDSFDVFVTSAPPQVALGAADGTTVDEGDLVQLTVDVTDPTLELADNVESWTFEVDWGDSDSPSFETFAVSVNGSGAATASLEHVYVENGSYTVTVRVTDHESDVGESTLPFSVDNVIPTILTVGVVESAMEGELLSFAVDVEDPGLDELTIEWEYGDGTNPALGDGALHAFADDGTYNVSVTVSDGDGGTASASIEVVVANVDPTFASSAPLQVDEGSLLDLSLASRFEDPAFSGLESFTYSVDWGDGFPSVRGNATVEQLGSEGLATTGLIPESHRYADNGTYELTMTISDGDGGSSTQTLEVVVANVEPSLEPALAQIVAEGAELRLVTLVSILDPGFDDMVASTEETFTFTIDWGDGSESDSGTATIDAVGSPGVETAASVGGAHTYADDGEYTVTITVEDDDGARSVATLLVEVTNVAPFALSTPDDFTIDQEVLTPPLTGTFEDPGADSWTVRVDWGDGSEVPAIVDPQARSFTAQTVYASPGVYTVTITVLDDEGGSDQTTLTATVEEVVVSTAPPTVAKAIPPLVVVEDADPISGYADLNVVFDDPDHSDTELAYSIVLNTAPGLAAVTLDSDGLLDVEFSENGFGSASVTLRATDPDGLSAETTLTIDVTSENDQPVVVHNISGLELGSNASFANNHAYLESIFEDVEDADEDLAYGITNTNPDLIDVVIDDSDSSLDVELLAAIAGSVDITVTATDTDGASVSTMFTVTVDFPPLQVVAMTPRANGFDVDFNRAIDLAELNLYDVESGELGAADVILEGANGGDGAGAGEALTLSGSLIVDPTGLRATFVAAGGIRILPADTYTVTLRSAIDAFQAPGGGLLDGDGDGAPGGDFVGQFSFDPQSTLVIDIADFARGPGQPVDLPADGSGLPIRLSGATDLQTLSFAIIFDPELLEVEDVLPSAELPEDVIFSANTSTPGLVSISLARATPFGVDSLELGTIVANVPIGARYGDGHVFSFENLVANDGTLTSLGRGAAHVVAYIGDVTGNGGYSALDASLILRHATDMDAGFAAFPAYDPVLIADVTGSGDVSSLDATHILLEHTGTDSPLIPDLPARAPMLALMEVGPRRVEIIGDTGLKATGFAPGKMVPLAVAIDEGPQFAAVSLRVAYDPAVLKITESGIRLADAFAGGVLSVGIDAAQGVIDIALVTADSLQPSSDGGTAELGGSIVELDFSVLENSKCGETVVDLVEVQIDEGRIELDPAPAPGFDALDARLEIEAKECEGKTALKGDESTLGTKEGTKSSSTTPDDSSRSLVPLLGAFLPVTRYESPTAPLTMDSITSWDTGYTWFDQIE